MASYKLYRMGKSIIQVTAFSSTRILLWLLRQNLAVLYAYPDKYIYVIAHELCHKILHSLDRGRKHSERDERETDIAVVVSGFGNSCVSAKSVDCGLGYLNMSEAKYLKETTDDVLNEIKEKMNEVYNEYRTFRHANDEKIVFLNSLYKAKKLRDKNEWSIDYVSAGEDYNRLLILQAYKRR